MKINLLHSLFHTDCKRKNKIITALLIFAMVVAGIGVPRTSKAEEVTTEEMTVIIGVRYSGFMIQDKLGNILFETVNDKGITQQDMERVTYISYEKPSIYDCDAEGPITDFLQITGDINMVITCTSENEFSIYIQHGTHQEHYSYSAIPGTVINISDNGVTKTIPTTKIRWKKVKKAERYVLYRVYRYNGRIKRRDKLDVYKKATNCTVPDKKGDEYQITAQRKIKGKWKTLRIFDITI